MSSDHIMYANSAAIIRITSEYLAPYGARRRTWEVEGVIIYGCQIANRSGVPDAAATYRLWFEGPNWQMTVRAVWRDGELHRPTATHTVILDYLPADDGPAVPVDVLAMRVNDWLMGIAL